MLQGRQRSGFMTPHTSYWQVYPVMPHSQTCITPCKPVRTGVPLTLLYAACCAGLVPIAVFSPDVSALSIHMMPKTGCKIGPISMFTWKRNSPHSMWYHCSIPMWARPQTSRLAWPFRCTPTWPSTLYYLTTCPAVSRVRCSQKFHARRRQSTHALSQHLHGALYGVLALLDERADAALLQWLKGTAAWGQVRRDGVPWRAPQSFSSAS